MKDGSKGTCFIGLHNDKIHKEVDLTNAAGNIIGIVVINRCDDCGRVKAKEILTVRQNY